RDTGVALLILTAPGAVSYAGSLYLLKLVENARIAVDSSPARVVIDCSDATGYALGALRAGWRDIMVDGSDAVRRKVADIAAQDVARLIDRPVGPALDLAGVDDPVRACLEFATRMAVSGIALAMPPSYPGAGNKNEEWEGAGRAPNDDDDR
ncbi:MAG: hypothetical protein ACTSWM_09320, partial [Alphaproteobacteria bacterium]